MKSTENNRTVKEIFDAIKLAKGFRKNYELAALIGTSRQNIYHWQQRNSIGSYNLFTDVGFAELFMRTGEGPMFAGTKSGLEIKPHPSEGERRKTPGRRPHDMLPKVES